MSVNKHQPHVMVLPEDDANRQIANGFVLEVDPDRVRRIQVLREAGGWVEVLGEFESEHVAEMDRFPGLLMVLVLDLDGHADRLTSASSRIPERLKDRVFVIGALTQPEELRRSVARSYEEIGVALASDCRHDQSNMWGHDLLRHNGGEVRRLSRAVRTLLFN